MDNGNIASKVITGKVRLSYAHIFEPAAMQEGQEKKYSCSLIIPKSDSATLGKIKKAVDYVKNSTAAVAKWGGKVPPNLKMPLRDGDIDRPDDENYAGCYFINCSAKTKPGIVDRNRNPILDQDEVYSGCYVVVSVNFYAFNTNGNRGIAAGLNNIMKIAEGEPLGGRQSAESDFADVEIAYEDDYSDMLG
jgi:hypothetical protein